MSNINWQERQDEPWKEFLRCPVSYESEIYIYRRGPLTKEAIAKLITILQTIGAGE